MRGRYEWTWVFAACRKQPRRGSVPAAKALLDHQGRFEKDQAADRELERIRVACFPLKDRRRQRAPARVVAILDE